MTTTKDLAERLQTQLEKRDDETGETLADHLEFTERGTVQSPEIGAPPENASPEELAAWLERSRFRLMVSELRRLSTILTRWHDVEDHGLKGAKELNAAVDLSGPKVRDFTPMATVADQISRVERNGIYWRTWAHLSAFLPSVSEGTWRSYSQALTARALGSASNPVGRAYNQLECDGLLHKQGHQKGSVYCIVPIWQAGHLNHRLAKQLPRELTKADLLERALFYEGEDGS
jgi:hypothetical protein